MRTCARKICAVALAFVLAGGAAFGAEAWRADFEEVCGRTAEAMSLSVQDLKGLVEKCDRVQQRLDAEDETVRKVYLKRLRMCRDLYLYVLEAKNQSSPSER